METLLIDFLPLDQIIGGRFKISDAPEMIGIIDKFKPQKKARAKSAPKREDLSSGSDLQEGKIVKPAESSNMSSMKRRMTTMVEKICDSSQDSIMGRHTSKSLSFDPEVFNSIQKLMTGAQFREIQVKFVAS